MVLPGSFESSRQARMLCSGRSGTAFVLTSASASGSSKQATRAVQPVWRAPGGGAVETSCVPAAHFLPHSRRRGRSGDVKGLTCTGVSRARMIGKPKGKLKESQNFKLAGKPRRSRETFSFVQVDSGYPKYGTEHTNGISNTFRIYSPADYLLC
ncbi:hypothetical protein EDB85DRAFT_1068605 [Lactarius pseudohatsudake]|nr:hypothetical protein EDB85DRAFT_1068605 [Lactarius pseudohatsudake]